MARSDRPPFVLRAAVENDFDFIHSTWTKTSHQAPPWAFMAPELFVPYQTRIIGSCMRTGITLVACDPEEPSTIYALVNHIGPTINWLYTRQKVRHMGFADILLRKVLGPAYRREPVRFSCWSRHLYTWIPDKVRLSYEPHQVMG